MSNYKNNIELIKCCQFCSGDDCPEIVSASLLYRHSEKISILLNYD